MSTIWCVGLGGKTCVSLLRMLKLMLHSGQYIVLDSGFCVWRELVELRKKGVFAAVLIKNGKYWPTLIPGEHILEYFREKTVGSVYAISGIIDGIKYSIWCMKEPEYCMNIMATGGCSPLLMEGR